MGPSQLSWSMGDSLGVVNAREYRSEKTRRAPVWRPWCGENASARTLYYLGRPVPR